MNHSIRKEAVVGFTLSILIFCQDLGGAWAQSYYSDGREDFNEIMGIVRGAQDCRPGESTQACERRVDREYEQKLMKELYQNEPYQLSPFEESIFGTMKEVDKNLNRSHSTPNPGHTGDYNCNTGNSHTGDAVNDFANGVFEQVRRFERRQNGTYSTEDKAIDELCAKRAQEMAPFIDAQLRSSKIIAGTKKSQLDRGKKEELWQDYITWKRLRDFVH